MYMITNCTIFEKLVLLICTTSQLVRPYFYILLVNSSRASLYARLEHSVSRGANQSRRYHYLRIIQVGVGNIIQRLAGMRDNT